MAVTARRASAALAEALQRRGSVSTRLAAALSGWDSHYTLGHALQVRPATVVQQLLHVNFSTSPDGRLQIICAVCCSITCRWHRQWYLGIWVCEDRHNDAHGCRLLVVFVTAEHCCALLPVQRWRTSMQERVEARDLYALAFEHQYLSIGRRVLWAFAQAVHTHKVTWSSAPMRNARQKASQYKACCGRCFENLHGTVVH